MIDFYQGDPRVFITNDGSEIVVRDGQPIMDGGFENAVLISLFTSEPWFANVLFDNLNQRIGSRFERANREPITLSQLNTIANEAELALQWMIDEGIASSVEATTRNPTGKIVETEIDISPLGKDVQTLLIQRNGQNWIIQINDPAYRRV